MINSKLGNWIFKYQPNRSLVKSQYQLAWLSLPLLAVCFLYLALNTSAFSQHLSLLLMTGAAYLAVHALAAIHIRQKIKASWRLILVSLLNIALVFITMALDTGLNSNIFLLFFIIMFISAYGFGPSMLIVTTVMILIGYLVIGILLGIPDVSTFIFHLLEISIIPLLGIVLSHKSQPAFVVQNKLISLLNQSPLPMFTYQVTGDKAYIRFANIITHQTFAHEAEKLSKSEVSLLTIPEDKEEMNAYCCNTLLEDREQKNKSFFIRGQNKQGDMLQLMCIADRLYWQGEHIGICFLFDITQSENQRNEMQNSMKEGYMSTLVAGIVHDFRNVLTNIIGTAEILDFSITGEKEKEQIQRIIQSGEQGSETITHLLQLSNVNKNKKSRLVHVTQQTLHSMIELLRIQLPKHIQLQCSIAQNLPLIYFDPTQLEQVLMNLINNATQAMKKRGKISVSITSEIKDVDQTIWLKISIQDNGCGIKEEELPLITQSFWTSRADSGGTGLGLAMVKRIVNQHGGKLNITSTFGKGTTVDVFLPETQQESGITTIEKDKIKTPFQLPSQSKPCRILLVDDATDVLEVHRMLLESMGHTVYAATNAQEAIRIFDVENIQLLITDLKMPEIDGLALSLLLREKSLKLPVLIISAYENDNDLSHIRNLNIHLLLKPGTFQKLGETIVKIQAENPDIFS